MQQVDKATAAGKGEAGQDVKPNKKATARRKKAEKPSMWKRDTLKETRLPAATVSEEYTLSVDQWDRDTFRKRWMRAWDSNMESIELKTTVPNMRFTHTYSHIHFARPISTLQVFEVRISSTSCFKWPLDVYGIVAARDLVDSYKRNIIFERARDDCQTITEKVPYLSLSGPTRAVVLLEPVYFEVDLKVKGTGQSEDQDLIFLAEPFRDNVPLKSFLCKFTYTGEISTLELTLGQIIESVEATISMKVIHGSWPDGFRGFFAAKTDSINDVVIPLFQTSDNKLPVSDDGMIKLQRCVVSAEIVKGEHLEVFVKANGVAGERFDDALLFKPQLAGKLSGMLNVGSCEIEVTVTWSRVKWC